MRIKNDLMLHTKVAISSGKGRAMVISSELVLCTKTPCQS
jgi:hypothetical protein